MFTMNSGKAHQKTLQVLSFFWEEGDFGAKLAV